MKSDSYNITLVLSQILVIFQHLKLGARPNLSEGSTLLYTNAKVWLVCQWKMPVTPVGDFIITPITDDRQMFV